MRWLDWLSGRSNNDRNSLFKYASLARWDIVQQCQLRFTQLGDLNDPFETQAVRPISEVGSREFYEYASKMGSPSIFTPQEMQDRAIRRRQAELARDEYINKVLSLLGVLSLAEHRDNLLMWAHYADSHNGILIEFNLNKFFAADYHPRNWPCEHDSLFKLRKIKYKRGVPRLNSDSRKGLEQLVFTKSTDWSYEQEWRLCRAVNDADSVVSKDSRFPIYLFSFPTLAIHSVSFGCRISREQIQELTKTIRKDRKYEHIKFYSVQLREDRSGICLLNEPVQPG
ncbi:MAG: DUF2971 domain-containing protein [Candidatus Competibacteraceae bacterium]